MTWHIKSECSILNTAVQYVCNYRYIQGWRWWAFFFFFFFSTASCLQTDNAWGTKIKMFQKETILCNWKVWSHTKAMTMGQEINTHIFSPWWNNYRAIIFWLVRKKTVGRRVRANTRLYTSTSFRSLLLFLCWLGSVCALTCSKTCFFFLNGGAQEALKPVHVGLLTVLGDERIAVKFSDPVPPVPAHPTSKDPVHRWPVCPASRQMDEQQEDYGEEEEAAWYLTKAMAASSLQNSSRTITPSSRVMWSIVMPSGSRPNNLFLTSSSLGVKSGMRWILNMRSPTTLTMTENRDLQPGARLM